MIKNYTPELFKKLYPALWNNFPKHIQLELLSDKRYIVKAGHLDGDFVVEFGFKDDVWALR